MDYTKSMIYPDTIEDMDNYYDGGSPPNTIKEEPDWDEDEG